MFNGTSCSIFFISKPTTATSLKIDGTTHQLTSAATASGYDCNNPTSLNALAIDTLYQYNTVNATGYLYRNSAKRRITVEYPTTTTKNFAVNACGFTTIDSPDRANGFSTTDTVKINGTETTLANIPIITMPPICRNGVLYQAP
jgi:hypothetical protein